MATGTTLFIRSVDGSNSFTYFLTPPNVLGGAVPTSPWGRPLSYQRLGNDFTVFTMTPWPEVLVIHYDSRDADGVRTFPF